MSYEKQCEQQIRLEALKLAIEAAKTNPMRIGFDEVCAHADMIAGYIRGEEFVATEKLQAEAQPEPRDISHTITKEQMDKADAQLVESPRRGRPKLVLAPKTTDKDIF